MRICDPDSHILCDEQEVYENLLPLEGARILELGCGAAQKTRAIAEAHRTASILALETDTVQHAKNQQIADLPNVTFGLAGAEDIPAADGSFDVVFMFKSLHHVPLDKMDRALAEIRRVLRPGGLAYISEPVYAGSFNDILRLFHDEQAVREAAFAAVKRAVESGLLELATQRFFNTAMAFDDFGQFDQRIIQVTHTQHRLSPELYEQVKARFEAHMTPQGAQFEMPIRVDLLRRPA
jgi:ubiquinone/menaquinone biosynthesis C-methylase UbiE